MRPFFPPFKIECLLFKLNASFWYQTQAPNLATSYAKKMALQYFGFLQFVFQTFEVWRFKKLAFG